MFWTAPFCYAVLQWVWIWGLVMCALCAHPFWSGVGWLAGTVASWPWLGFTFEFAGLSLVMGILMLIQSEVQMQHEIDTGTHGAVLPSDLLYRLALWWRRFMLDMGRWLARLFNPLFYLKKFWRYVRPYYEAIRRLTQAVQPDALPGYYFLQGFFSEHYGYLTAILATLFAGTTVYWYKEHWSAILGPYYQHKGLFNSLGASFVLAGLWWLYINAGTSRAFERGSTKRKATPPPSTRPTRRRRVQPVLSDESDESDELEPESPLIDVTLLTD
jgi:hypothetical protein